LLLEQDALLSICASTGMRIFEKFLYKLSGSGVYWLNIGL